MLRGRVERRVLRTIVSSGACVSGAPTLGPSASATLSCRIECVGCPSSRGMERPTTFCRRIFVGDLAPFAYGRSTVTPCRRNSHAVPACSPKKTARHSLVPKLGATARAPAARAVEAFAETVGDSGGSDVRDVVVGRRRASAALAPPHLELDQRFDQRSTPATSRAGPASGPDLIDGAGAFEDALANRSITHALAVADQHSVSSASLPSCK